MYSGFGDIKQRKLYLIIYILKIHIMSSNLLRMTSPNLIHLHTYIYIYIMGSNFLRIASPHSPILHMDIYIYIFHYYIILIHPYTGVIYIYIIKYTLYIAANGLH